MGHISHWINGALYDDTATRRGDIFNPATGELTDTVSFAGPDEVRAAVSAAARAFPGWRDTSLAKRTSAMFALRELMVRHTDELADAIVRQHGKVENDAKGEIARGLEVVEFACGLGELLKGEYSENASTGVDVYSVRQPLGVVVGITPFNFPAMVPLWMFPMALATGNTFVLKPSEKDPAASMILARLVHEAGFPPGVFNVLHGDREAVEGLLQHPDVAAVSFVGSTAIARSIYETATAAGKRVQALGGAKNHMVVLPDADLDDAADAAVSAGYGSAGERCMAASVLVAVGGCGDQLIEKITARVATLRVGAGTDPTSEMGPLVSREHREKVAGYVATGEQEGARVALDGRELTVDGYPGGFWLGPCLLDDVRTDMRVYNEEIFGPVLSVVRVETLDEAISLISEHEYGNGAAIFTSSGEAARRFQHGVAAGMVGVNVAIPVPVAYHSFGGWKHSLFGDLHIYGPDGVRFYTRNKVITSRWTQGAQHQSLNFPSGANEPTASN